jgi:exopolysaccharide biosynthesis protein
MKASQSMWRTLTIAASLLLFGARGNTGWAATEFETIGKGIEFREFDWTPEAAPSVHVAILRVDPRVASIEAADTRLMSSKHFTADSTITTDSAITTGSTFAFSLREIERLRHPLAAINGGPTGSYSYPLPVGLLQIDGVTKSPLNVKTNQQTGIVCIRADGSVSIVSRDEVASSKCRDAVQAGPLLIKYRGIKADLETPRTLVAERTLICVDGNARVLFINTSPVSLYAIADALATNGSIQLDIVTALNLDGSASSGLIFRRSKGLEIRGNIDATIPDALIVMPRN